MMSAIISKSSEQQQQQEEVGRQEQERRHSPDLQAGTSGGRMESMQHDSTPMTSSLLQTTPLAPRNKNNKDKMMVLHHSQEDEIIAQRSNGHPNRGAKTCCLCWCCCCSCKSCCRVPNGEGNNSRPIDNNKLEILNGDNEPPPTIEDIRTWGESFDKLMKCNAGRTIFRDFLKCEYSEENILFWLACEDLKKECSAELVEEKARNIYEDYISILSPKEVSLDSRVREVINRNMVEPSPHTFDEAQLQIYTLMHRDSYPRFVNSSMYKKLAQLNTSSRKESSA